MPDLATATGKVITEQKYYLTDWLEGGHVEVVLVDLGQCALLG